MTNIDRSFEIALNNPNVIRTLQKYYPLYQGVEVSGEYFRFKGEFEEFSFDDFPSYDELEYFWNRENNGGNKNVIPITVFQAKSDEE